MERTNYNRYLFKALEAYPYELEVAVEALNYALTYDPENAVALYLMGRVYSEQLGDYEAAKVYYSEALAADMDCPYIYPYYVYTLLLNENYKEAKKLLDYALTVRSTDKGLMHMYEGFLYEFQGKFRKAIKSMKVAKKITFNEDLDTYLGRQIKRIEKKLPVKKEKSKNASKKKNAPNRGILRRLNLL